jgi:hypothetical protein
LTKIKEGDLEKKAQQDNHEGLWTSSRSRRANAKNQYNGVKPVIRSEAYADVLLNAP